MLGWVAAVIAIVSPSQPRPAVIQRTSSSVTASLFLEANAIRYSVDDIISLQFWKRKRHRHQTSRPSRVTKLVGESYACVGGYAHSHNFLNVRRIEVLRGLSAVAACNHEVHPGIQAPILLFWGGLDKNIPPETTRPVADKLRAAGKPYTNVEFSWADHGFFCDARATYNADAAIQSWELTKAFLAAHSK